MADASVVSYTPMRIVHGFIAGFLATLIVHQLAVALLWSLGITPFAPYSVAPTEPFGVPAVISLAFWGGVWGIAFSLVDRGFPRGGGYWVAAFLFGGILPTLVAFLVVVPLKGGPVGAGWQFSAWLLGIGINGAWGLGTGAILRLLAGGRG